MRDQRVKNIDLIRLLCLYSLRYEKSSSSELSSLRDLLLKRGGLQDRELEFVNRICNYGGCKSRETDLFSNQNPMAITKRILKGFKVSERIDFLVVLFVCL